MVSDLQKCTSVNCRQEGGGGGGWGGVWGGGGGGAGGYSREFLVRVCRPVRIFLFCSYSFGIETISKFRRSRSSLENYTRFQTKMGKVYTRFQTKKAQTPVPLGRHIPIWLI